METLYNGFSIKTQDVPHADNPTITVSQWDVYDSDGKHVYGGYCDNEQESLSDAKIAIN